MTMVGAAAAATVMTPTTTTATSVATSTASTASASSGNPKQEEEEAGEVNQEEETPPPLPPSSSSSPGWISLSLPVGLVVAEQPSSSSSQVNKDFLSYLCQWLDLRVMVAEDVKDENDDDEDEDDEETNPTNTTNTTKNNASIPEGAIVVQATRNLDFLEEQEEDTRCNSTTILLFQQVFQLLTGDALGLLKSTTSTTTSTIVLISINDISLEGLTKEQVDELVRTAGGSASSDGGLDDHQDDDDTKDTNGPLSRPRFTLNFRIVQQPPPGVTNNINTTKTTTNTNEWRKRVMILDVVPAVAAAASTPTPTPTPTMDGTTTATTTLLSLDSIGMEVQEEEEEEAPVIIPATTTTTNSSLTTPHPNNDDSPPTEEEEEGVLPKKDRPPPLRIIQSLDKCPVLQNTCIFEGDQLLLPTTATATATPSSFFVLQVLLIDTMVPERDRAGATRNAADGEATIRNWRKGFVAVSGGALVGVGAVLMVTPLHPIGHAMAMGGIAVLGTEFEKPRKMLTRARSGLGSFMSNHSRGSRGSRGGGDRGKAADDDDDDDGSNPDNGHGHSHSHRRSHSHHQRPVRRKLKTSKSLDDEQFLHQQGGDGGYIEGGQQQQQQQVEGGMTRSKSFDGPRRMLTRARSGLVNYWSSNHTRPDDDHHGRHNATFDTHGNEGEEGNNSQFDGDGSDDDSRGEFGEEEEEITILPRSIDTSRRDNDNPLEDSVCTFGTNEASSHGNADEKDQRLDTPLSPPAPAGAAASPTDLKETSGTSNASRRSNTDTRTEMLERARAKRLSRKPSDLTASSNEENRTDSTARRKRRSGSGSLGSSRSTSGSRARSLTDLKETSGTSNAPRRSNTDTRTEMLERARAKRLSRKPSDLTASSNEENRTDSTARRKRRSGSGSLGSSRTISGSRARSLGRRPRRSHTSTTTSSPGSSGDVTTTSTVTTSVGSRASRSGSRAGSATSAIDDRKAQLKERVENRRRQREAERKKTSPEFERENVMDS